MSLQKEPEASTPMGSVCISPLNSEFFVVITFKNTPTSCLTISSLTLYPSSSQNMVQGALRPAQGSQHQS